jgi:gas vesicle protein
MDMKEQIQSYVAPDLSGFQEQLSVMDQKLISIEDITIQSSDFTRDIRTDLKSDIRRIEVLTDDTDRRVKEIQRSIDESLRQLEAVNREMEKDVRNTMRETENRIDDSMRRLEEDLNKKIQEALDNPLNN